MSQKEKKPSEIAIMWGETLRRIRASKGWSQEEAAKQYKCSVKTWGSWERGKWPQGATGERLGMALVTLFKLPTNPFAAEGAYLPLIVGKTQEELRAIEDLGRLFKIVAEELDRKDKEDIANRIAQRLIFEKKR